LALLLHTADARGKIAAHVAATNIEAFVLGTDGTNKKRMKRVFDVKSEQIGSVRTEKPTYMRCHRVQNQRRIEGSKGMEIKISPWVKVYFHILKAAELRQIEWRISSKCISRHKAQGAVVLEDLPTGCRYCWRKAIMTPPFVFKHLLVRRGLRDSSLLDFRPTCSSHEPTQFLKYLRRPLQMDSFDS
jgi:hypothetical protein